METERDWPECDVDLSGIYHHFECHMCKQPFNGYKSRLICHECHKDNEVYEH